MNCSPEENYIQLNSKLKNKEALFDFKGEDMTIEEFENRLNIVDNLIEKDYANEGLYVKKGTKEVALKTTITKKAKKNKTFVETPSAKFSAEAGVELHKINELLLKAIFNSKLQGKKFDKKNFKYTPSINIGDGIIDKLIQSAEELVQLAFDKQKEIDPTKAPRLYTEFKILDAKEDIGGTGDVLFVYSNLNYSYFDYKNITTNNYKRVKKVLKDGKTVISIENNPINNYDLDYWENQVSEIKRILTNVFELKDAVHTRIIPTMMDLSLKNKKINFIATSMDSDFLMQIPVAKELTGNVKTDLYITNQFAVLKLLHKKLSKTRDITKRDSILERIEKVQNSIKKIQVKGDIQGAILELKFLLLEIHSKGEINDINDPNYMSTADMNSYLEELYIYREIFSSSMLENIDKETNAAERKKLIEDKNKIIGSIVVKIDDLNAKLRERVIDDAFKLGVEAEFDSSGNILTKEENVLRLTFKSASQLGNDNFYFGVLSEMTSRSFIKTEQRLKEVIKEMEKVTSALFKFGKSKGLSKSDTFKLLYDEKTGSLHYELAKEFYEKIKEERSKKNANWFIKNYELKEGAKEKIESWREQEVQKHKHVLETLVLEGEIDEIIADNILTEKMLSWDKKYNVITHEEAWYSDKAVYFIKLKSDVKKQNASKEFNEILNTPELLEYYNVYQDFITEARDALGLSYSEMPNNFIPEIRSDMVDMVFNKGIYSPITHFNEFMSSFKIRDDDYMANIDEVTGKIKRTIPKLFLNRPKDANYNKSFDLSSSMILFMNMALNHKHMSEIEANLLALKSVASMNAVNLDQDPNKPVKTNFMGKVLSIKPEDSQNLKALDAFIDYYLYGIKIQDTGVGGNAQWVKNLQTIKNYISQSTLGLKVSTAAAAYIAPKIGLWIEQSKEQLFSKKELIKANKLFFSDRKKALGIAAFFNMHSESNTMRESRKLSSTMAKKWISMDNLFFMLRKADEKVDQEIAVAMSLHFGLDPVSNRVKQLKNLPEGTKSIYDSLKIDENGDLSIEGMTENQFAQFKKALREGQTRVKGTMSEQDIYYGHTNLLVNMFMQFKSWMPGVAKERLGKINYNTTLDAVTIGRYVAAYDEFKKDANQKFTEYFFTTFITKLGALIIEIGSLGLKKMHVSETRAKRMFEEWKKANPKKTKGVTFEQYKEAKEKQIRAMTMELRIIIGLFLLIVTIGGDDDDKVKDMSWGHRQIYRILNRANTELAFFYNPIETTRILGNASIPSFSMLIQKLGNWSVNTVDEFKDIIYGENYAGDKTDPFYRTFEFFPGGIGVRSFFDTMFEADTDKER